MTPSDRLFYILLGCVIGYIIGRLDRRVKDIERKLDEVDDHVIHHDERGSISFEVLRNLAVLLVVLVSFVASVRSQNASNRSDAAVSRVETIAYCSKQTLGDLIVAVNERSTNTKPLAKSNLQFQQSFRELVGQLIHVPPFSQDANFKATKSFFDNQGELILKQKEQLGDVQANPLPTINRYNKCLTEGKH